jgi:2-methylisocitrate lyase-like PEP mutase family enzyme
VGKIQAATAARDALDPSFVICARCDVVGSESGTFDDAVERCIAYVERGRADLVWINTLQTREQITEACRRIPAPVLPAYGGSPPSPTLEEWQAMGAAVALFPALTTSAALQATWDLLHDFKERGTAALQDAGARARESRWGVADRGKLVGTPDVKELESRFLPDTLQRDYQATYGFRDHQPG